MCIYVYFQEFSQSRNPSFWNHASVCSILNDPRTIVSPFSERRTSLFLSRDKSLFDSVPLRKQMWNVSRIKSVRLKNHWPTKQVHQSHDTFSFRSLHLILRIAGSHLSLLIFLPVAHSFARNTGIMKRAHSRTSRGLRYRGELVSPRNSNSPFFFPFGFSFSEIEIGATSLVSPNFPIRPLFEPGDTFASDKLRVQQIVSLPQTGYHPT